MKNIEKYKKKPNFKLNKMLLESQTDSFPHEKNK